MERRAGLAAWVLRVGNQFAKIPVGQNLSGGSQKATCKIGELDLQPGFFPACRNLHWPRVGGGTRPVVSSLPRLTGSAVVSGAPSVCLVWNSCQWLSGVGAQSQAPGAATQAPSLSTMS